MGRVTGGRRRAARRTAVGVLAACVLLGSAAPAGAVVLYAVVLTPLAANQYSASDFSVTASNLSLLDDLGCLQVDVPASFTIVSVTQPDASNDEEWLIRRSGQSVLVQSDGGGGRLELGDSVTFTVRAKPQQAGLFAWQHHAHEDHDCDSGDLLGAPPTVTVLPALLPTPVPTTLPTPTLPPLPTTLPTPTLPPLPSTLPTPEPTPRPPPPPSPDTAPTASTAPTVRPTPGPPRANEESPSGSSPPERAATQPPGGGAASPALSAAEAPSPDAIPAVDDGPRPGSGLDLRGQRQMRLPGPADDGGGLALSPFSLLVDMGAWYVPAAVVGGPGLLVIGFVALQLGGAAAWMPAVRRLRGDRDQPVAR